MVRTKRKGATFDIGRHNNSGWYWDGWTRGGEGLPVPTAKLGLWLFLAVVAMLFAAFTSAYLVRMPMPDWRSVPKPLILWLNTFVLLLSSATAQWALMSVKRGRFDNLRKGLTATMILGLAFVLGQLLAWRQLAMAGIYLQTNPASSFFYLLTAIHGLHLLGGIIALIWATVRAWRNEFATHRYLAVELCVFYWHFLAFLWVWLFALMLLR
ncbi:MAG: cytochrome c oxidase subunit 3 [Armatimonadetes bacterium]|nr:cytochrome c oxidase subunit 3 [Armatimonadota bacterium]MDW8028668.1 cytochrome c oxidase subunit 3 [Armatimonadota bacterium]